MARDSHPHRSRAAAVALAVAAFVALAIAFTGPSANEAEAASAKRPATSSLPGATESGRAANRRAAKRRAWRRSRAGRRARARSRTAHRGLKRTAAVRVARAAFPLDVNREAWHGPRLQAGERLKGYLDRNTALIDTGEHDAVATASFPLVTETGVPVDMRLVERGGAVEPETPLIPLRISRSPRTGAVVGSSGLGIAPAGGAGDAAAVVEDKVFYANVDTDTDLIVEPTLTGLETFTQLRSTASPEDPALDLRLPKGSRLRPAGAGTLPGSLEIVRGNDRLVLIDRPAAIDADGEPVPVTYGIEGSRLVLRVPHRSGSYRYPILVDPDAHVWEDFRGWPDTKYWEAVSYGNWAWGPSGGSPFSNAALGCPECHYTVGQWHQFRWPTTAGTNPPVANEAHYRDAFVFRADTSVDYSPSGSQLVQGFWPDQAWVIGTGTTLGGTTNTLCIRGFCGGSFPDGTPNGTDGNFFFHSLEITVAGWRYGAFSKLNWALFMVHDRHAPSVGSTSWKVNDADHNTANWIGANKTVKLSTPVSDRGLGLRQAELVRRVGGALVTPSTRTVEGCYSGVLPHDTTPDFNGGPWHGQTQPGPDQGDRNRQCPLSQTYGSTWSFNSNGIAEGVNHVGVDAYDIVGRKAPVTNGTFLRIDRSGPELTDVSGTLYDRRNRSDDRRFQGLYGPSYTLSVSAADGTTTSDATRRSGVKRIDIDVVNAQTMAVEASHPDPQPQSCAAGNCTKTRPFTFTSDNYTDGEKIIRITAYDQLDNPTSRDYFRVTVDRRGDVYNAKQYTADPASGGELVSEEWVRFGTRTARHVDPDAISTRRTVPCTDGVPSGPQCDQVAFRTRMGENSTTVKDAYQLIRGSSVTDPSVPQVADALDPVTLTGAPTQTGTLTDALQPWQSPPPAAGPQYAMHERTYVNEEDADTYTSRLWIDGTTRLPLKETLQRAGEPGVVAHFYWTYGVSRETVDSFPADFFAVQRPARVGKETTVTDLGARRLASVTDAETGGTFRPYWLGPAPSLGASGAFCLASTDLVRFTSTLQPSSTEIDPELPPPPPYGPETLTNANYVGLEPNTSCVAGQRDAPTPAVEVISHAPGSSAAIAWRDAYVGAGQAIALDPNDADFSRGGMQPVVANLTPTIAYVIVRDDQKISALIQLADAQVIVTGPFAKTDLPLIVTQLQPQ